MNPTMNETAHLSILDSTNHLDGMLSVSKMSKVLILCVASIFLLIGIPGNILVIWTYVSVKSLQSLQNAFVINLAICDTIIIGYLLPLNMSAVVMGKCPMTGTMCAINGGIAHICFTTSVQTIMHIAVLRYLIICCKHNLLKQCYTTRYVYVILTGSWIVGIIFLIPLYCMDKKIIFDETLHMCIFDRYGNALYTAIYKTLCLALPIAVTSTCYIFVYRKVIRSKKQLSRHCNIALPKKRYVHEMAVTRSQFAVFVAYMILYLPFGIIATVVNERGDVPNSLHAAGIYLCYANSCVNGIIYGLLNSNIRRAYMDALPCVFKRSIVRFDSTTSEEKIGHNNTAKEFVTVSTMTHDDVPM